MHKAISLQLGIAVRIERCTLLGMTSYRCDIAGTSSTVASNIVFGLNQTLAGAGDIRQ
jgi:hypothetical protein